jgi:glycerol-3-phosphate dehydrogenase (NAD(P)+)
MSTPSSTPKTTTTKPSNPSTPATTPARSAIGFLGESSTCTALGLRAIQSAAASQNRPPKVLIHCTNDLSPLLPDGLTHTPDIEQLGAQCFLILLASPPSQLRGWIRALGASLDGSHMLLHAVRGFEPGRQVPMSSVIREETCVRKIGAFVGPSLLLLGNDQPGAAVVASRFAEVINATQQAFSGPGFRVYGNADLAGVEISSVLIGALAVAVGLCMEMNLGSAVVSLLLTRGLAEITRFVKALGGQPQTPFGLSGLGDLMVQRDVDSAEVRLGRALLRTGSLEGAKAELVSSDEIVASVQAVVSLGQKKGVEANILPTVRDLLTGACSPPEAMRRLMTLQQMTE